MGLNALKVKAIRGSSVANFTAGMREREDASRTREIMIHFSSELELVVRPASGALS